MAIISGIFNSINGDRRYDAKWFARYFATFIGNGVFPNPSTGLQVTENTKMTTAVKAGDGWINGYFIVNDGDYVLQHDVADGVLKRIDRVVMRLDFFEREIDVVIKKGVYASTPVPPALQRDADAYELALADVMINNGATFISQANITDLRLNKSLCGIVHGTVDQVDTTTIFNQYQAWFRDITSNTTAEINDWKVATQQEFNTWFDSIKGILEGDIAANLAAKISSLEGVVTTHLADKVSHIQPDERENWNAKATPEDVRIGIEQTTYSVTKSAPDEDGTFTTIEYKRKSDGSLAAKSALSGGTAPQYATRTITYYGTDGLPTGKVDVFALTYNADGALIGVV